MVGGEQNNDNDEIIKIPKMVYWHIVIYIVQVLPIMSDFKLEAVLPGNHQHYGLQDDPDDHTHQHLSRHSTPKGVGRETKETWLLWLSLPLEEEERGWRTTRWRGGGGGARMVWDTNHPP